MVGSGSAGARVRVYSSGFRDILPPKMERQMYAKMENLIKTNYLLGLPSRLLDFVSVTSKRCYCAYTKGY